MTNNNGTFCNTTIVSKKLGEMTSLPVMTLTSDYDITSGNVTNVASCHVTSDDVTSGGVNSGDVTSGSTPFPNYDGLHVLKTVKY